MNWHYICKTVSTILGGSIVVWYSYKYVCENSRRDTGWLPFLKVLGSAMALSFIVSGQKWPDGNEETFEISIIVFLIIFISDIIAQLASKEEND